MDLIVLKESLGAYMNINGSFLKMEGFSKLDSSSGVESYTRKYLSAEQKSTDITGTQEKISYTFDRMKNNCVHDVLALIADGGKTGESCNQEIVLVDFSEQQDGKFHAVKQRFAVLCKDKRPENGFLDYSGEFVANGEKIFGYVTLSDDCKTVEFTEQRRGILCDSNL